MTDNPDAPPEPESARPERSRRRSSRRSSGKSSKNSRARRAAAKQRKWAIIAASMLAGCFILAAIYFMRPPPAIESLPVPDATVTGAPIPSATSISPNVHVLGDSFVGADGFQAAMTSALTGRGVTFDGVGGSTLEEQYYRFAGGAVPDSAETPGAGQFFKGTFDHWDDILVIMDGGLTDLQPIFEIEKIIGAQTGACKRWLYVEPVFSAGQFGAKGSPNYDRQKRLLQSIQTQYPGNYLATHDFLLGKGDGSPQDTSDIANGWTPRSLRGEKDPVQLNSKGSALLAGLIAERIAKGPLPCTPTKAE